MSDPLEGLNWDGSQPMPDGFVPLQAVLVVEGLDEDGDQALLAFGTEGLPTWTAIGMATYAADRLRRGLQRDADDSA